MLTILHGDALSKLAEVESESVQTCVTSPPYWGLRSYGTEPVVWDNHNGCEHEWESTQQYQDSPIRSGAEGIGFHDAETTKSQRWRTQDFCACGAWRGELGLEPTPELYVQHLVEIFREVRRVLRKDGTLWLNLGDSYARNPGRGVKFEAKSARTYLHSQQAAEGNRGPEVPTGCKEKDLVGIPWMVAFALRADGWYLRSDIIWSKPNPMPESVTDRPTKSHEYIFLLSKSGRYYYDAEAIRESQTESSVERSRYGWAGRTDDGSGGARTGSSFRRMAESGEPIATIPADGRRNKRSVWTVTTRGYTDAHFATFPPKLIEPCILAGAPVGGVVLDPFAGSGTTGRVAIKFGRKAILIEPKAEYIEMINKRTAGVQFDVLSIAQGEHNGTQT